MIEAKRLYRDPFVFISGDFNQWNLEQALEEFVDLSEVDVGPSRGQRSIDRTFCNMGRSVIECGTVPPLETEAETADEAAKSDHMITYIKAELPRQ